MDGVFEVIFEIFANDSQGKGGDMKIVMILFAVSFYSCGMPQEVSQPEIRDGKSKNITAKTCSGPLNLTPKKKCQNFHTDSER